VKKNSRGDEPARSIRHGTRSFLAARETSRVSRADGPTWPGDRRQLDMGGLGSRPLDAALQASKEVAVPSTLKHPINAANLDQLLDEFENDLVAAGGFAVSSP